MFKALSNPHRLSIFLSLVECCPRADRTVSVDEARRYVGELGEKLDIAPSTVSHHVKELRHAGLIQVERRGKNILCRADEDALRAMVELLGGRVLGSSEG
jgi:ArsR family transcriptional regulator